jgi:hypothetical protein
VTGWLGHRRDYQEPCSPSTRHAATAQDHKPSPWRHLNPGSETGTKSGQTDRLVGYSPSARMVIVVIYLREGLIGVNAWRANPTQARRYWEEEDRA